jgi:heme/copper-type cytochrome/quinol oxidase subunit 2
MKILRWSALCACTALLAPASARACSACFVRADDTTVKAASLSIVFLFVILLGILGGVAGFFITLMRRARRAEIAELAEEGRVLLEEES